MLLKVKGMSENMNSKLTADAWLDINITAGICGICKLFIALHKKKKKKNPVMPEYLLWSNYIFCATCKRNSLAVYEV